MMMMLGGNGVQETEDDVPRGPDARCGEGREEEGSEDYDHDVILVSSSPCKVTRQSVTPLSTSDRDVEAGPSSGGIAAGGPLSIQCPLILAQAVVPGNPLLYQCVLPTRTQTACQVDIVY